MKYLALLIAPVKSWHNYINTDRLVVKERMSKTPVLVSAPAVGRLERPSHKTAVNYRLYITTKEVMDVHSGHLSIIASSHSDRAVINIYKIHKVNLVTNAP